MPPRQFELLVQFSAPVMLILSQHALMQHPGFSLDPALEYLVEGLRDSLGDESESFVLFRIWRGFDRNGM